MVRTTQTERQEILDATITVFNAVIDGHQVDGREYTGLREQDVKLTQCTRSNKHGHFYCYSDNSIKLGVNYNWWWTQLPERKLVFLLHEFTHESVSGHSPEFWERHDDLVKAAMNADDVIENHFDNIEWSEVPFEFAGSVNMTTVDHRYESVMERRREIAREYGLPVKSQPDDYGVDLFDGVYVTRYRSWNGQRATSLKLNTVSFPSKSDSELVDWLTSNPDDIFVKDGSYHIKPVDAKDVGHYQYTVENDAYVATFLDRVGENRITAFVD